MFLTMQRYKKNLTYANKLAKKDEEPHPDPPHKGGGITPPRPSPQGRGDNPTPTLPTREGERKQEEERKDAPTEVARTEQRGQPPQERGIRSGISHPPILADTKNRGNAERETERDFPSAKIGGYKRGEMPNGKRRKRRKKTKKEGFGTKFVGDKREENA